MEEKRERRQKSVRLKREESDGRKALDWRDKRETSEKRYTEEKRERREKSVRLKRRDRIDRKTVD